MAIAFVAAGTWTAGTTSIAPPLPAGMAAGGLMLLAVHTPNQAVTKPSGWTEVTSSPVSTGTAGAAGGTRITLYYRWWQSGDTAPTVAVSGGTSTQARIFGYSGVDPTTPFDGVTPATTTLATANTSLTMSGVTTNSANDLIFFAVARDVDAASTTGVTAFTNANLTSITERNDQTVTTGPGGGLWVCEGKKATAGATGTTAVTQTSSIAVGLTVALRPDINHNLTGALTGSGAVVTGAALRTPAGQPTLISTTAITLGTSATPGAQSITVPADAQLVVVQATTYATGGLTLSLVSSFAGTFTVENAGAGSDQCHIAYALVSSTGSQTITPTWSGAVTDGPLFLVSFVKGINTSDFLRDAVAFNANSQGTTASTSIATGSNDLLLVMDRQAATTTPPGTMSGYVSVTTQGNNNIGGRVETCSYPGASSTTVTTDGTEFPGLSMISIKPASGPVTHALTGVLTGPGSTVSGATNRFRAHDLSGTPTGPGSTIAGSTSRSAGAVTHDLSGALTGPGSTVAGAARRYREFGLTGALTGQGSSLSGATNRFRTFSLSGALVGQGATVAGATNRWRAFSCSGVLVGAGSTIAGSLARTRVHDLSGNLVGPGSAVSGATQHNIPHALTGALTGPGSTITGSTARNTSAVTHDLTGALTGQGSAVSGSSNRYRQFALSGALVGQGSQLSGSTARSRVHDLSGALVGQGSALSGATQHNVTHQLTGALVGIGSLLSGVTTRTGSGTTITFDQVLMIADIWQRLGLNPAAPLTETEAAAVAGGLVLTKAGTPLVSTRSGSSAPGDLTAMLLDIWQRLGLDPGNPMTATETAVSAGGVAQTIAPVTGGVLVTRT